MDKAHTRLAVVCAVPNPTYGTICLRLLSALQCGMPTLTRRLSPGRNDCWHVCYGDVRVGTISRRTGNPFGSPAFHWDCGFHPIHPREHRDGASKTFDEARVAFEAAWLVFLARRTEADFAAWRAQRDFTAAKYARFDRRGLKG
jgi:hypothetical protein